MSPLYLWKNLMAEANIRSEKYDTPICNNIKKATVFPVNEKDALVYTSAQDSRRGTIAVIDVVSPRGVVIEDRDRLQCYDSDTSSSTESQTRSSQVNPTLWRKGISRLWKQKSMKGSHGFPPIGPKLIRWKSHKESHGKPGSSPDNELCFFKPSWKTFTITELQNATSNFSEDNIIGKGGFAEVYKGRLEDGQLVAVKRLNQGTSDERTNDFLAELGILCHVNHPNTAKLVGVGFEGGMHLVLSLSPHGSLSNFLHDDSPETLGWGVRYKIAIGTAMGLEYLHERCLRRIIHRDIKADNILLTEDFEPQICDFGLAKWLPDELTHHTISSFEGTFGYLAPEYLMHGVVDEKTDVFAFGVLLLELISGRKALDSSQKSLLMWARPLMEKHDFKELLDPSLGDSYDSEQLTRLAEAAFLCVQQSPILRPIMNQVLEQLQGEGMLDSTVAHQMPVRRRTYSEELHDAEEYNSTRYLNDLNRHKQIALDLGDS